MMPNRSSGRDVCLPRPKRFKCILLTMVQAAKGCKFSGIKEVLIKEGFSSIRIMFYEYPIQILSNQQGLKMLSF